MSDKKTILFIEDEESIAMMYQYNFQTAGFRSLTASKAKDGISVAKEHHPDIILLDIKLGVGDGDGLDVLKILKEDVATKDIPVILFSNAYQKEYEAKGKELGAEGFILKTKVMPDDMVKILKKRLKVK